MIMYCIATIIIVSIICATNIINTYINKKTDEYKSKLKKREEFMSKIGFYIDEIDKNYNKLDISPDAKNMIRYRLNDIKRTIFNYCDDLTVN